MDRPPAVLCPPAAASDYTGAGAIFIGFPSMLFAACIMGLLVSFPSWRGRKLTACLVFFPASLIGLALFFDARELGRVVVIPYLLLLFLIAGLFLKVILSSATRRDDASADDA